MQTKSTLDMRVCDKCKVFCSFQSRTTPAIVCRYVSIEVCCIFTR